MVVVSILTASLMTNLISLWMATVHALHTEMDFLMQEQSSLVQVQSLVQSKSRMNSTVSRIDCSNMVGTNCLNEYDNADWAAPNTCVYEVDTGGQSCKTKCVEFGYVCYQSMDNLDGCLRNVEGHGRQTTEENGCLQTYGNQICACGEATMPPTSSPTTSSPTASPTMSPTTSSPTSSPTMSPTTSSPTSSPTMSPTTSSPTSSPTMSPTTSSPTSTPTQSPTTLSPTSSPTTLSPTSSPTTSVKTTVMLEGDYNAVVAQDKPQFLADCSAYLSPVTCFDAAPGSIALTLEGSSGDVNSAITGINHNGLSIPGYATMNAEVTATGDPHLTTVAGQSFDLKLHGNVTLLRMPRGSEGAAVMLHVDAITRRYQADECSTLYIERIRVSGKWVRDTKTPDRLFVARHGPRKRYLHLGPGIVLVISNGMTDSGIIYLNFRARKLQSANMTIGGLLGGESYPWDAQMAGCAEREATALLMTSAEVSVTPKKMHASTASASLGAMDDLHELHDWEE